MADAYVQAVIKHRFPIFIMEYIHDSAIHHVFQQSPFTDIFHTAGIALIPLFCLSNGISEIIIST